MIFKEGQAIYLQIAERLADEILSGKYLADSRVPGVREYAALMEVNVNTVVKAFEHLFNRNILYNRRGLGYFVSADSKEIISEMRREDFKNRYLPELFKHMQQLDIGLEEIEQEFRKYKL